MTTHCIISTHTADRLGPTLRAVLAQDGEIGLVVVTCDGADPAVGEVVEREAAAAGRGVLLVTRPHQGQSRSSQVRNNGVRALLREGGGSALQGDRVWFLDGDCIPAAGALAAHERLGAGGGVVIGFRHDLTASQTARVHADPSAGVAGLVTREQCASLASRARRYRRALLLRRLGLGKAHKPKLLSANFSVPLAAHLAVNGFDEAYVGYGQEDDDLGRRLYRAGVRPVVGVEEAVVFHQFHPTRAPGDWGESPNAARFARGFEARCPHGVENPAAQPGPVVSWCGRRPGGVSLSVCAGAGGR